MIYELNAISTGKIETLTYCKKQMQSALNKTVFTDTCWLTTTGFCVDEQAYKGHGGPDKALCLFSKSNYQMWQDDITELPDYAMFGENLTAKHMDEKTTYFGNQYQLGSAIIEVSEIREPCWKIQTKYQIPDLVKRMSSSGRTGFYFRVLKEGYVAPDDNLHLIQQAPDDTLLSVFELNHLMYNDRNNISKLTYALQNPYLTTARIDKLQRLLTKAQQL